MFVGAFCSSTSAMQYAQNSFDPQSPKFAYHLFQKFTDSSVSLELTVKLWTNSYVFRATLVTATHSQATSQRNNFAIA